MSDSRSGGPLVEMSVSDLLQSLASGEPAPGGGAASAIAAAMAAALGRMVAGLTLGRDKFRAVQDDMALWNEEIRALQERLERLADADASAYARVIEAYGLPKDTVEQQEARSRAVQKALQGAAEVPLNTAGACVEVLQALEKVAAHGNPNASGDAAVGALLAHAALRGAARNVRINLRQIADEEYRQATAAQITQLVEHGEAALVWALATIDGGQ
jgi:formiminotetrahydrofolate cyclodeaminase